MRKADVILTEWELRVSKIIMNFEQLLFPKLQ